MRIWKWLENTRGVFMITFGCRRVLGLDQTRRASITSVAKRNTYEGTRTLDHRLKRPALYRLSYAGWCQVQDSNPHLPIFKEGYVSDYTNLACLLNTLIRFSYISLFSKRKKNREKAKKKIKWENVCCVVWQKKNAMCPEQESNPQFPE